MRLSYGITRVERVVIVGSSGILPALAGDGGKRAVAGRFRHFGASIGGAVTRGLTLADVERKVYEILGDICGPTAEEIAPDADLVQAIALDSMATVRLVAEVSNTFSISFGIEPKDLDDLATIRILAGAVTARLHQRPGARIGKRE